MGRFVRACPRCCAVLRELRCPQHRIVDRWIVVDLRAGVILGAGRHDRLMLGPLLASMSSLLLEEHAAALPKTPHPRAA